jgi:polyisoprenoid-binding protein YceI
MRVKSYAAFILSAAFIVSFIPSAGLASQDTAPGSGGGVTPDVYTGGRVTEFEVVAGKSSVEFIGTSLMHHFHGVSHEPSGFTSVDFGNPRATTSAEITVPVDSIKGIALGSEKSDLSKNIHENLESEKYPDIKFKVTQILPESTDASAPSKSSYLLKGDLTIHNMTKPVVLTADTEIKDGYLHVTGEYDNLDMTDYGVEPKPLFAVVSVNDVVDVKFDLYEDLRESAPVHSSVR